MVWLLIEAGVALAIGLFIVWWTWPKKDPGKADEKRPGNGRHG